MPFTNTSQTQPLWIHAIAVANTLISSPSFFLWVCNAFAQWRHITAWDVVAYAGAWLSLPIMWCLL